ncbi:MAG TPA: hypothetical protein VEJ36_00705 [Nitrososphaerales archaeon]|nr:hypothetical protein [Nitrososphaerales archaeon]
MRIGEEKRYSAFVDGLKDFVVDLNHLSEEGWIVLVEGARDARALKGIGYSGRVSTLSGPKARRSSLGFPKGVVILTDLDREGGRLAARYSRRLVHEGYRVSLKERRRLLEASGGVFRHVENLSRFFDQLGD